MAKEIERKWLLKPEAEPVIIQRSNGKSEIQQMYLSFGDPEIRIRRRNKTSSMTVKYGNGLIRDEIETYIPNYFAAQLLEVNKSKTLEKTRYEIFDEEKWFDIDVYSGKYSGLIVAEVEFGNTKLVWDFKPPLWLDLLIVRELTGEPTYSNKYLAEHL